MLNIQLLFYLVVGLTLWFTVFNLEEVFSFIDDDSLVTYSEVWQYKPIVSFTIEKSSISVEMWI